jgi:hypothetical protein
MFLHPLAPGDSFMSKDWQIILVRLRTSKYCSSLGIGSLLILFFFCVGCSKEPALYPVEGKVIFKGKEVGGATVIFHPKDGDPVKSHRSVGMTGDDGTFKLKTGDQSGAPAGTYKVTLLCSKELPAAKKKREMNMNMSVETHDFFEGAYAEIGKSKIEVTVKAGDNKLEPFRLD